MSTNEDLLQNVNHYLRERLMLRERQQASLRMLLTWTNIPRPPSDLWERGAIYMRTRVGNLQKQAFPENFSQVVWCFDTYQKDTLLAITINTHIETLIYMCVCICVYIYIMKYDHIYCSDGNLVSAPLLPLQKYSRLLPEAQDCTYRVFKPLDLPCVLFSLSPYLWGLENHLGVLGPINWSF